MEKKFKAQDKLARRAERKLAQENGTNLSTDALDDSSEDENASEDSAMDVPDEQQI
ncbi:hypothetical protein K227x_52260 [Rubripirellula lacrimiformis]|uniref:Uncharacterized protein n=1 Tax=Rubripirellula lacrimiformis TaxID=1930273 RepID=A0A517NI45_9BACT|nr:hypothetical protein [Rubripirellula lacrimiformis]QDT06810.1 hypothetical protein K227x_52260 [Rubripirellula lacrimiformis]